MAHFTRAIKTNIPLVYAIRDYETTLHAEGCSHLRVSDMPRPFVASEFVQHEDWFNVAPCAALNRKTKTVCDKGTCGSCAL